METVLDGDGVLVERDGAVDWVTLNRPESLNAITQEMTSALHSYFDGLTRNYNVRVVVLRGAGRGFCAGLDLKQGEVGEIYLRGPHLAEFTYNNDDAKRREIALGDLVTVGDVGYQDADGYVFLCDRKRDMIISGGVNIYPAEIESVLIQMPGVRDCAVFGIPDEEFGEQICAHVEPLAGVAVDAGAVRAYLAEHLARYKIPKVVELSASLPREDSGKIFKRKLRAPYWEKAGRSI